MVDKHPVINRDEWLARRAHDLTASDIGAAVGVDRFKTPLQLFAEKTGQIMPSSDTPAMRRGRWLESAVMSAIAEEHPDWEIRPSKIYFRDPVLRLGATPDAVCIVPDKPGITNVQCKVVSRPVFERDWSEGPPLSYQLQTTCEAMLMDAHQSIIAALVIDTYNADLQLFDLPRHGGAEERIKQVAADFWLRVAEGRPPAANYARDEELIEQLHPTSVAEPVLDLSADNRLAVLLPQWWALKEGMAIDKKQLSEIEAEIKEKLGDAERAQLPGWEISWKTQTRKEHVVKASTYRVLRIHESDEEEAAA